jgi:hypothetical protein
MSNERLFVFRDGRPTTPSAPSLWDSLGLLSSLKSRKKLGEAFGHEAGISADFCPQFAGEQD